jgi:hypothetical protein
MEKKVRVEDVVAGLNREILECLVALEQCMNDDQFKAIEQRRKFLVQCKEKCLLEMRGSVGG